MQYARIQYETDGKASMNKKNKKPKGARAPPPKAAPCFSYSYLLFHLSRIEYVRIEYVRIGYVRIDTCVLRIDTRVSRIVRIAYWNS